MNCPICKIDTAPTQLRKVGMCKVCAKKQLKNMEEK
jgi:hypothetical protein